MGIKALGVVIYGAGGLMSIFCELLLIRNMLMHDGWAPVLFALLLSIVITFIGGAVYELADILDDAERQRRRARVRERRRTSYSDFWDD